MEGLQDIWGWQPALYLFLGGMGAGAFIAAMVVYFREGDKARSTVFASLVAAVVCLAVGLLLLLSELITPLRGMMAELLELRLVDDLRRLDRVRGSRGIRS